MNGIFFHMTGYKKNHQQKMTKTLETNITSDKGEEKSSSQNSNQNPPAKKHHNLYLIQYQKYFHKKLVIKYNILPNEYTLMKLDNFITAKYCHSLASFKEKLIYNYDEEFLNRFYSKKESLKKVPLFADFYKSYLTFFCFPTLSELKLNDLIEDMVEKKAKAFYNENFVEKNDRNDKKINVVIFTNKIRKDISRRNSLTNLTKTTIKNRSITNKSSVTLNTIEKIYNEMNNEKKTNNSNNNINNNKNSVKINNNNLSKGLKNSVILHKIRKKIKNDEKEKEKEKEKEIFNINNKTKLKNKAIITDDSSGKRKKITNKISRNIKNALSEKKTSIINSHKISNIQKNINLILKLNPKISQRISSNSKNNTEKNKAKELKNRNATKTLDLSNIYRNYYNTLNNNSTIQNNILLSNYNNNTHNGNLKVHSTNININYINNINNNKKFNFIKHRTVSNSYNTSNRNIQKKAIKVSQKPSMQNKIKQIRQIKSRNYKSCINDINININTNPIINDMYSTQTKNDLMTQNINKETVSDYCTINNTKNINSVSIKVSNKKLKPKIKLIKPENKTELIYKQKSQNINTNAKVFHFIASRKKNTNNFITSYANKVNNGSSSSSLQNLNEKKSVINNGARKNSAYHPKNYTNINTKSYVIYDSQKIIKNLKIVTNEERTTTGNDIKKNKVIKNYYKK